MVTVPCDGQFSFAGPATVHLRDPVNPQEFLNNFYSHTREPFGWANGVNAVMTSPL